MGTWDESLLSGIEAIFRQIAWFTNIWLENAAIYVQWIYLRKGTIEVNVGVSSSITWGNHGY